jgi:hypothetical protein
MQRWFWILYPESVFDVSLGSCQGKHPSIFVIWNEVLKIVRGLVVFGLLSSSNSIAHMDMSSTFVGSAGVNEYATPRNMIYAARVLSYTYTSLMRLFGTSYRLSAPFVIRIPFTSRTVQRGNVQCNMVWTFVSLDSRNASSRFTSADSIVRGKTRTYILGHARKNLSCSARI